MTSISPVQEIIGELQDGRMVVLVDEQDRENEGDLVAAAEHVTPQMINFMAKYGRGLICLALSEARCHQLQLAQMVADNRASHRTAFTVSIEAASGVTTGISVHDRAHTIRTAVARDARPGDIVQPGHVFPLMARPGGVLVRAGHTEAGCDLMQMAGLEPAAVICEIMNEEGGMARFPELAAFAAQHELKIGTISDLIRYRSETEQLVVCVADHMIATASGHFRLRAFSDSTSGDTHLALTRGEIEASEAVLVRVHEVKSVLDFLDSEPNLHSMSIHQALQTIDQEGRGVLVLLHISEDFSQHMVQGLRLDTKEQAQPGLDDRWDPRSYGIGAQILKAVGIGRMRLMLSLIHI